MPNESFGDQMMQQLFDSFGLTVEAKPVIDAVRARGYGTDYVGASFVSVVLATAAYLEAGTQDMDRAIDQAVETLEQYGGGLQK